MNRIAFSVLISFHIAFNVTAQDTGPSDELSRDFVAKLGLKGYSVITEFYNPAGKKYSADTLLKRGYDKDGKLLYTWRYSLDIVDMLDSTAFVYDTMGRLIAKNRYTIYDPKNESTEDDDDILPPIDTFAVKYTYDQGNKLIYSIATAEWGPALWDTTWYKYDDDGNLIKMVRNNETTIYKYKKGKLVKKDLVVTELDLGLVREAPYSNSTVYSYNASGRMELIVETRDEGKKISKTEYIYDDKEQIVEMKKYFNGKFNYHVKYTYDENGLLLTESSLNEETGRLEMRDSRNYEYYK